MALSYKQLRMHQDGKERASIPAWVHLTREQVEAVQKLAESKGLKWRSGLLHQIAEAAILRAIGTK